MKALYNGYDNNGRIMFSARLAAEALNCNKDSATAYFKDLKQKGFIVETKGGYLGVDGRGKGRLWRLTEIGFMGDRPTKDYRKWKSEKTKPRPNSSDRVSEKPGQFPTRVSERFGQGVRKVRTEMP